MAVGAGGDEEAAVAGGDSDRGVEDGHEDDRGSPGIAQGGLIVDGNGQIGEGASGQIGLAAQHAQQLAIVADGGVLKALFVEALAFGEGGRDEGKYRGQAMVSAVVLAHQRVEAAEQAFGDGLGGLGAHTAGEADHQSHGDDQHRDGGEHFDEGVTSAENTKGADQTGIRRIGFALHANHLTNCAGISKLVTSSVFLLVSRPKVPSGPAAQRR